jgi:hypothetical protein
MPAVSKAQQEMMAIGEHNPDALYPENRDILKMGKKKLHDFSTTKRSDLPKRKKKKNALLSLINGDAAVAKKIAKGGK